MGRKCQLRLVYVGQGSSHSQQQVEAADEEAHISEDARPVATPVASDDDETLALGIGHVFEYTDDYVQTPTPVQNPAPVQNPTSENRPGKRGKTKLADIWAMTGEYKIQLPLNDEGQPIDNDGSLFVRWLGSFCENGLLCPLSPAGWPSVPQKFKNDCWTEIEQRYIIDPTIVKPPNQIGWAMSQLGELRRNRRTKLKKDHKKPGLSRE
uniref:Transposase n=1 Tax=Quercus lobata TaxID=97700 RepID=A0A7N2MYU4_QUELO